MAYLSRRDIEDLKPSIDKLVYKTLGTSDSSVLQKALDCLGSGYDKRKTGDRLASYVDSKKASRLAEKIFDLVENFQANNRAKKRSHDDDRERDYKRNKTSSSSTRSEKSSSEKSISDKEREDSRVVNDRPKHMTPLPPPSEKTKISIGGLNIPAPSIYGIPQGLLNKADADKAAKIAALQATIKGKLASGILGNSAIQIPLIPPKPQPLILDEEGRTVDNTGKAVTLTHVAPTLKANLRALKTKDGKDNSHAPAAARYKEQEETSNKEPMFVDPRIGMKPAMRTKRALRFHEPGKFQQQAERLRMKNQLEKLQNEISQIAKKTGISSATKLALIAKNEGVSDEVPQMEWWDSVILDDNLDTVKDGKISMKADGINNLVEHPTQMRCPTDPLKPVYMPVFLTKKERKKLRRQNRREAWKEEQEKIRLGLEPPPEPKLRISNLMRALGTEAVQDPTKIEAHVREQMAKRKKAHEDANAARKLTAEQKREKKIKKTKEDTTLGFHVAIYRVLHLHNVPAKKFKIETNAKQLMLTGCVVLYPDCCVVVVEGGPKAQKKYKRLMLNRIKWEEDMVKDPDGNEVPNKCVLVWEGTTKQKSFGEIKFKVTPTEKMAREHFKKHKVEHYWDLAYSGAVLEQASDLVE